MSWTDLQTLGEMASYHYAGLVRSDGGWTLILENYDHEEMTFQAPTPEEAVELACDRLRIIAGLLP